jgi:hypothetical protein
MTDRDKQGGRPSDEETLTGDTASSDRLNPRKGVQPGDAESRNENPPRTTTGNFTAPKFGSAGSGGAELEPGPERD